MPQKKSADMSTSSSDDENARGGRFASIRPESLRTMSEAAGFSPVADDVLALLSEDLSYRLREVLYNVRKISVHTRRDRITCEDINHALHNADVDPILGHLRSDGQSWVRCGDVYAASDPQVDLVKQTLQEPLATPRSPPAIKASWVNMEAAESRSGRTSSKDKTEIHVAFFEEKINKVMKSDAATRKSALEDIRINQHPALVTPWIIDLICKEPLSSLTLQEYIVDLTKALVLNDHICWESNMHLRSLCDVLYKIILQEEAVSGHWTLRQRAATLLAYIVLRRSSPCHQLYTVQLEQLSKVLEDSNKPLCALVGCVQTLGMLGTHAVDEVLLPNLSHIMKRLEHESAGLSPDSVDHDITNMLSASLKEVLSVFLCKIQQVESVIPKKDSSSSSQSHEKQHQKVKPCNELLDLYKTICDVFGDSCLQYQSPELLRYCRASNYEPKVSLTDSSDHIPGEILLEKILKSDSSLQDLSSSTFKAPSQPASRKRLSSSDGKKPQSVGRKRRGSSKRSSKRRKMSGEVSEQVFEPSKNFKIRSLSRIVIGTKGSTPTQTQRPSPTATPDDTASTLPSYATLSSQMKLYGKHGSMLTAKTNLYQRFIHTLKQVSVDGIHAVL